MTRVSLLLLVGLLAGAPRAEAGWGLRNSFGQAIYLADPQPTPQVTVNVDQADGTVDTTTRLAKNCDGKLCYDGNRRLPIDFEIMPYYSFGLISVDLGVAFNLEQRTDLGFNFHFRPGLRIFPFMGIFIRGFLDLTAAQIAASTNSTGSVRATFEGALGIGAGYQFKLGPWGIFGEFSLSPRLWGAGRFNMPIEFRVGILLEP